MMIGVIGALAILESKDDLAIALIIIFTILAIVLMFIGFFMKDEKLELEKRQLELDKMKFEYERQKETKTELEKRIQELFVDWYEYIRYGYPAEVKEAFGGGQPFHTEVITLGDRLHACYKGQLMSESNPEDVKLENDLKDLYHKTITFAVERSSDEQMIREYALLNKIFPIQYEILGKIWKKIKNPQSEYGE